MSYVIIARRLPLQPSVKDMHALLKNWLNNELDFETWMPSIKPDFEHTSAYFTFKNQSEANQAYNVLNIKPRYIGKHQLSFSKPEPRRRPKSQKSPAAAAKAPAMKPVEPADKPTLVVPKPVYLQPAPTVEFSLPFDCSNNTFWEQYWAKKAPLVSALSKLGIRVDNDFTTVVTLRGGEDALKQYSVPMFEKVFMQDVVYRTFHLPKGPIPDDFDNNMTILIKTLPISLRYNKKMVHVYAMHSDLADAAVCCVRGLFID